MKTLLSLLREQMAQAMGAAFATPINPSAVELFPCAQKAFGHYQCNSALSLAKSLRLPPQEVARRIIAQLDTSLAEKVEIAGPGFINITLSSLFLSKELEQQKNDLLLGAAAHRGQEIQKAARSRPQ